MKIFQKKMLNFLENHKEKYDFDYFLKILITAE